MTMTLSCMSGKCGVYKLSCYKLGSNSDSESSSTFEITFIICTASTLQTAYHD